MIPRLLVLTTVSLLAASVSLTAAGSVSAETDGPCKTESGHKVTCDWSSPSSTEWTVPTGVTSVFVIVTGAQGGGEYGGKGGYTAATLPIGPEVGKLHPGEKLQLNVGGKGGTGSPSNGRNGGGNEASYWGTRGGGGGGASDIRTADSKGGYPLANRILVAGGGGGGNWNNGGAGAGANEDGQNGGGLPFSWNSSSPALGGSQTAGGAGAWSAGKYLECTGGYGVIGKGGDGYSCGGPGGGGGGGFYGGGGGTDGAGGGGGSGYAYPQATNVNSFPGLQDGDGEVIITFTPPA